MKGFTLIEALVATAIITIAISAPLYSASRSMNTAQNTQSQLVASYLAQEGVEYVRLMRDNEYLAVANSPTATDDAWTNFTTGNDQWSIKSCIAKNCTLEVVSAPQSLTPCINNDCSGKYLHLLPAGSTYPGAYTQDTTLANNQLGVATPFVRAITATTISSTDELITSTVTWSFHDVLYSVTINDHLTPWQ